MIQNWDLAFLQWIAQFLHKPWIVALFYAITLLGNAGLVWLLFAGYFRFQKKNTRYALLVIAALVLTSLATDGIVKNLVCRPRPFVEHSEIVPLLIRPSSYSFPSGHSSTSFASAMMIYLLQPKLGRWALLTAALIAFSRLVLQVHYPTDVLAGALLGISMACVLYAVFEKRRAA